MKFVTLRSVLYSLLLHVFAIGLLVINMETPVNPLPPPRSNAKVINAVTIDEKQIEAEVNRLKEADRKKQQKKLNEIKNRAAKAERERKAEEMRLRELKKKKQEEQKQLAETKKQNEELERKRKIEEEKKLKAEEERKRIEEEKRKAEEERKRPCKNNWPRNKNSGKQSKTAKTWLQFSNMRPGLKTPLPRSLISPACLPACPASFISG